MNRTIKFRGKRRDNGEWVYGYLYYYQGKPRISHEIVEHPTYSDPGGTWIYKEEIVDPATVGQFTGLYDRDGKEIYEGDVCENIDGQTLIVRYVQNGFEMRLPDGFLVKASGVGDMSWFFNVIITGNIHDNPELLNNA